MSSRRRKSRLLGVIWRRPCRGFEARRHDGEVLCRRGRLSRRLFLEELLLSARLNTPVVSLAWIILGSLNLDKILVQAKVMANTILPAGVIGVIK